MCKYIISIIAISANVLSTLFKYTCLLPLQWNLSIEDAIGTQLSVLCTEVSLTAVVDLYTALCGWDCRQCSHQRGVSNSEVDLYIYIYIYIYIYVVETADIQSH